MPYVLGKLNQTDALSRPASWRRRVATAYDLGLAENGRDQVASDLKAVSGGKFPDAEGAVSGACPICAIYHEFIARWAAERNLAASGAVNLTEPSPDDPVLDYPSSAPR